MCGVVVLLFLVSFCTCAVSVDFALDTETELASLHVSTPWKKVTSFGFSFGFSSQRKQSVQGNNERQLLSTEDLHDWFKDNVRGEAILVLERHVNKALADWPHEVYTKPSNPSLFNVHQFLEEWLKRNGVRCTPAQHTIACQRLLAQW